MSYSLNSSKGGYILDYKADELLQGLLRGCWSLDYSSWFLYTSGFRYQDLVVWFGLISPMSVPRTLWDDG